MTTPRATWRDNLSGCATVGCFVGSAVIGLAIVVALLIGVDRVGGWISPIVDDLQHQAPIQALAGIGLIGFAALGGFRMATGQSIPGVRASSTLREAAILVGIAVLGVLVLLQGINGGAL